MKLFYLLGLKNINRLSFIDYFGADVFGKHGIHPRSVLYIVEKRWSRNQKMLFWTIIMIQVVLEGADEVTMTGYMHPQ